MKPSRHRNVSLARALSKLGFTSRSRAEEMIRAGHATVNGKVVTDASMRVSLTSDILSVDGMTLGRKRLIYIALNKPTSVVTTRSDERGRMTVYDLIGDVGRWVFPVGRLDKETSGLLLLTNDNQLGERLTNPRSKVPKTYRVQLDRRLLDDHVDVLQRGMVLNGERLRPATVKRMDGSCIELTIFEGKNRQIRRMCKALGYNILSLERTKIGNLRLGDLSPGRWKILRDNELKALISSDRPSG